jgi:hypothetical protein
MPDGRAIVAASAPVPMAQTAQSPERHCRRLRLSVEIDASQRQDFSLRAV